jgi:dienelactone hydrolase
VRFDETGRCIGQAHYAAVAEAASRSVDATLAWLRTQRWADATHVLLVGQSMGGLTTVAAAATRPAGVVGFVNFAGGTGGNALYAPGRPCDVDQLTRLYGRLGATTTMPSLWLYARDDDWWGPTAPLQWHAAFARGGSAATFVQAPPQGDGHALSNQAERAWSPDVDRFLATIPFDEAPGTDVPSRPQDWPVR